MSIYKLSNDELESFFTANKLYTKEIKNFNRTIDKKSSFFASANIIIEDFQNVLVLKKNYYSFKDLEVDFFGDGCYLSCMYIKYASQAVIHMVSNTKEKTSSLNDRITLFSGHFGRSEKGKVLVKENSVINIFQIVAKRGLIKQMAEIDGRHSKLFEFEYQQKLDKSILLDNIYSPTAILIIEQILNTKYQGQLKEKYVEMKTIELMLHLMNLSFKEVDIDAKSTLAERTMLYIENNFSKNIRISDIAKYLGVSEATLRLKFKEKFNKSISNVINCLRKQEVDKLLKVNLSFSEIADILNYKNQTDLKNKYLNWG